MAPRKSERIMNLAICLLMARRFLDKSHLREVVEGYSGLSDAAFDRTFERDKDDLRAMGIPVETGSNSPLFPDEIGYRIRRQDFELPPIDFTAAEATALGLASQVWGTAAQAERTTSALAKLRAAGVDPDASRLSGISPSIGAKEQAFEPLWQATMSHTAVSFGYRGVRREVEPWMLTYRRGSWYLLGLDRTRGAARMFKLTRFEDAPQTVGKPESYRVPDDVDLAELSRSLEPAPAASEAVVAIRGDKAPGLRRRGVPTETTAALPPGFAAWRVPYSSDAEFVTELCGYGPAVLVLEPLEVRRHVVERLGQVVAR
ncbi:helix-turn-helix transcriptional regulator [Micropruina sonneratiae]|uniref:helix-turn-helix transcriptional regulator n=1 Tax=Micropruina sonneratiae TaxID=2986940 RepID=UPI0022260DC2|nr:WYL domain-containing protein [Micropruina sp. KQZ13P-5]MCW3157952.1 WYL domain-containing protein [Micropruina sp. KQZ13P-5]